MLFVFSYYPMDVQTDAEGKKKLERDEEPEPHLEIAENHDL